MFKAVLLPLSREYGSFFLSGSIFLGVIYKRLQELFLVNQTNAMVDKTRSVLASLTRFRNTWEYKQAMSS